MSILDGTPLGIMRAACTADYGIIVGVMPASAAHSLRRQLYGERERQRRRGVADFDGLSFLVKRPTVRDPGYQVWIIKREKLRGGPPSFAWPSRSLALEEMPFRVAARGRLRRPFLTIPENSQKFPDISSHS